MIEDHELLQRYAEDGAEDAFAELVRRRIGLVYAIALRQTAGDAHRAQDVTQAVFIDLARKARSLSRAPVLAGWLCRAAHFAARDTARAAQRRAARENTAHLMHELTSPDADDHAWQAARPVIDTVLNELDTVDRDAIVLRFFDGRAFREIGERLQLSENAARMRVDRALEKLRVQLGRRGVASTNAALALALAHHASAAVPAGLATTVTSAALATAGASSGVAGAMALFVTANKLPLAVATVVAVAGVGLWSAQARDHGRLAAEMMSLRQETQLAASLRTENLALARTAAEVQQLRADTPALPQLRAEAAALRERVAAVQRANLTPTARPVRSAPTNIPPGTENVTLRLPDADLATVLSAYQVYTGRKVTRDPSLGRGQVFNLRIERPVPKAEAVKALEGLLAENGIALAPAADGSFVATRRSP